MFTISKIFQDGMLLQRGENIVIFGTGDAGENVQAKIQNQIASTTILEDSTWKICIPKLVASEYETLLIENNNIEYEFYDIAVGEVWIAAGQSNMEFWMRYEKHLAEELENCKNENIRFYDVPKVAYDGQEKEFDYSKMGIWRKAYDKNLEYFSGVGYFFAKKLYQQLKVPVGIVGCNWGGTSSHIWMSEETLKRVGEPWLLRYKNRIKNWNMDLYWEKQHGNVNNDIGYSKWNNELMEFINPKTPTLEEIAEKFGIPEQLQEEIPYAMFPQEIPSSLYEHMTCSIAPYSASGFLWYQGESDDLDGYQSLYKEMLKGIIGDWRKLWKKEDMPFLVVQLPGFSTWYTCKNSDYMTIRKMQEDVCKETRNTYLCSISDIGEEFDIHPKNKKDVGERLSLLALKYCYKQNILADAPRLKKVEKKEREIILTFDYTGDGLRLKGNVINALQVRKNGSLIEFETSVLGDTVHIFTQNILDGEIAVIFAYTKWYEVNLYNTAQIPAIPFRLKV